MAGRVTAHRHSRKYTYPAGWRAARSICKGAVSDQEGERHVNMYLFNTDRLLIWFLLIVTSEQSSESTANHLGLSLPLCRVRDVLCVVNKCIESRHTGDSSTLIKKRSQMRQMLGEGVGGWGGCCRDFECQYSSRHFIQLGFDAVPLFFSKSG